MGNSVAHMTLTAKLSKDPEVRTTQNGKNFCVLMLPVDNRKQGGSTWWKANIWGRAGETAYKHLKKGDWVCVSGKPYVNTWTRNDGSVTFSAELNTDSFEFVGTKVPRGIPQEAPFVSLSTSTPEEALSTIEALSDVNKIPF